MQYTTREQLPEIIFVAAGGFGGWDILTKTTEGSNMATVIATFDDKTRAMRAAEKVAEAFGSKFTGIRS